MNSTELMTRLDLTLAPDDRRVVIKLFVPGEDAQLVQNRASRLIERILQLDEDESGRLLEDVLTRFADPALASKLRTRNLRRYFAVQYTQSHVSVQCTNSGHPRLTKRSRTKNGVLMSDEANKGLLSPLRRKLLMGMAAVPAIVGNSHSIGHTVRISRSAIAGSANQPKTHSVPARPASIRRDQCDS